MIDIGLYLDLRKLLLAEPQYAEEYRWSETVKAPTDPDAFFAEYGWVVCNSGMRNQVAVLIWERVTEAIRAGRTISSGFGHLGKATALQQVYDERGEWFARWQRADDPVAFLETMPWIGPITKWHLAKNFGIECAKPDRHLVRIAGEEGVDALCARLAAVSGDRIATVDLVLWRSANLGRL